MSVYVAGHRGLVGSAICRALGGRVVTRERHELDLRHWGRTMSFFELERPNEVYLAAGTVGGIQANATYPATFIHDNLQIQTNVIEGCHRVNAKLLFLGSSCIYPRDAVQPIVEEAIGTGPLEPTNEAYAWAKLAGIAMVKAYRKQYGLRGICLMPTNLYGPNDNFDLTSSHLVPGLMARMYQAAWDTASKFYVWGTGTPRRELMHVDDLARACVKLMAEYEGEEIVNVGTGEDHTIREIAYRIADLVPFHGEILFDHSKPDGTPVKRLDVQRIHAMGWKAEIPLERGLAETYAWWRARR